MILNFLVLLADGNGQIGSSWGLTKAIVNTNPSIFFAH